jgi:hypothetical protein
MAQSRFSFRRIGALTGRSLRRFPLVLLSALVAGVSAAIMVAGGGADPVWRNVLMAATLGIPLLLTIALVAERGAAWGLPRAMRPVAATVAVVLLVIYGATLPIQFRVADVLRFLQLTVALHLLLAVAPFARRGEERGMWQFDLALLLRFVTAVFFSAVLFGGLSLALLALDKLLGLAIADELYLQLWFLIICVFNTAYVLAGVPEDLAALDRREEQPRVVRVLARSILAPLVMVYLVILLAYLVKVVVTAVWPSGWIGYLVSGVAVAGILSLLLAKLELDRPERSWLRIYARIFHLLMLPAVAMLALAVVQRINQYGVTEPRYFLLVLTGWLAAVVLAGCWRHPAPIKAIPATLAAVALVTMVGPWSAYAVAQRSQQARLETVLAATSRLEGGRIVAAEAPVSTVQQREISELLRYLFEHFGPGALGAAADAELRERLDAVAAGSGSRDTVPARELAEAAAEYAGVAYTAAASHRRGAGYAFERDGRRRAVPVAGWEHLVPLQLVREREQDFLLAADTCRVRVDWPAETLELELGAAGEVRLSLAPMLARLRALDRQGGGAVPDSLLDLAGAADGRPLLVHVQELWWNEDAAGRVEIGNLRGELLLSGGGE